VKPPSPTQNAADVEPPVQLAAGWIHVAETAANVRPVDA
jgi:hypothetical protein